MEKKSLILALGAIGLCQFHFLIKAPEWLTFGGARPAEPAPREGGRDDNNNLLKRDRGNELRDAWVNEGRKSGQDTTNRGGKQNPAGGKDGTSSSVPSGIILFEGRMGPGKLDKAEEAALRKINEERPRFGENEDKRNADDVSLAASRLAALKDTKIKVIEDFRSGLDREGLRFDVLRQCEGLKNYKIIEKEIQDFYKKVTKKGDFDSQQITIEMQKVLNVIKGQTPRLASQLYTREANKLLIQYPKEEDSITSAAKHAWQGDFKNGKGKDIDPFEWVFNEINSLRKKGEVTKKAAKAKNAKTATKK